MSDEESKKLGHPLDPQSDDWTYHREPTEQTGWSTSDGAHERQLGYGAPMSAVESYSDYYRRRGGWDSEVENNNAEKETDGRDKIGWSFFQRKNNNPERKLTSKKKVNNKFEDPSPASAIIGGMDKVSVEIASASDDQGQLLASAISDALSRARAAGNFVRNLGIICSTLKSLNFEEARPSQKDDLPINAKKKIYDPDKDGDPEDFLNANWSVELSLSQVSQNTLRKDDPNLMKALDKKFRNNRDALREIVPIKTDALNKELEVFNGGPVAPGDRNRVAAALRAARSGANKLQRLGLL